MNAMRDKFLGIVIGGLFVAFVCTMLGKEAAAQGGPHPAAVAHIPVCPGPASPGSSRCHARVVTDQRGQPQAQTSPNGYGPAQFLGAYQLSGTVSSATTIAIVDAYNHPNILSDL